MAIIETKFHFIGSKNKRWNNIGLRKCNDDIAVIKSIVKLHEEYN